MPGIEDVRAWADCVQELKGEVERLRAKVENLDNARKAALRVLRRSLYKSDWGYQAIDILQSAETEWMSEPPVCYTADRGKVGVWTCSVCGKRFEWRDEPGAEWLGSYKDVDDSAWKRISVVCCTACKSKVNHDD